MAPTVRPSAGLSPNTLRLLQLALTLLIAFYLLLAGGTFDATLRFRVKLVNMLAASALLVLWLAVRWRQRRALAATGLEWPLIVFALSQWLAFATSLRPRLSLEWAASILVWIVLFWLLHDVLAQGWPRRYMLQALTLIAVVLAGHGVLAAAGWYGGWLAAGQLPPVTFRYSGLLGHANLTACVLNLLLPVVMGQMLQTSRRLTRLALGLLAAGMLLTEYLTSSRAGWIVCAATLAVWVAMWAMRGDLRRHWPAWRARWAALGRLGQAGVVVGALAAVVVGGWLLVQQSQHITHGSLLQSRQEFWRAAWQLFLMQPLTGAGPDLFTWYYTGTQSIPPGFLAPHAHSLLFQILSGSGLIGVAALLWLAGAAAVRLWQQWRAQGRSLLTAGLLAGLAGFALHQLFDDLLTVPFSFCLLIAVAALALAPEQTHPTVPTVIRRRLPAWLPGLLSLSAAGVFTFSLRAEGLNETGLNLAAEHEWPAAAEVFAAADRADPGLDLYAQAAAYAYTQAGAVETAMPYWRRAVAANPYLAVLPATVGVLTDDWPTLQAGVNLAPNSSILVLNAGVLAEAQGDEAVARTAYTHVLDLGQTSPAALFWQQTPLRTAVLADWQSAQPVGGSALAQGEAALATGDAQAAIRFFQEAFAANPESNLAYAGLARAHWAAGDKAQARRFLEAGLQIPVTTLADTLPLRLLRGEFAAAEGDQPTALFAFAEVFSAINDYTLAGAGTYGYSQRSWYVYHRPALPSDLVPQFARADITPAMDADFAELAGWYAAAGNEELACFVLARVYAEAPASISGARWEAECAGQS